MNGDFSVTKKGVYHLLTRIFFQIATPWKCLGEVIFVGSVSVGRKVMEVGEIPWIPWWFPGRFAQQVVGCRSYQSKGPRGGLDFVDFGIKS